MTIVKKYKIYRKTCKELNSKIIKTCLKSDVFIKSARLLGFAHGDTLIFDNESEMDVLMDFALHEYRVNNKNTIEIYREKIGGQNKIEKEILDALISSYTSLFKITSICENENTLVLYDILNKKDNIRLIDIGLSTTTIPGLLLFIRLVGLKDFSMTSGISFVFPENLEVYLLKRYKRLSRKVKSESASIKRFISFFRLSKTDGIEVRYE